MEDYRGKTTQNHLSILIASWFPSISHMRVCPSTLINVLPNFVYKPESLIGILSSLRLGHPGLLNI